MKKLLICASAIGLSAAVVYWLYKKEQTKNTAPKAVDNKADLEPKIQEEDIPQDPNIVEAMHQAKGEAARTICERHAEAAEILKDAYRNIMDDFVEDFSVVENEETKAVHSDDKTVSIMNELDSISDELDNLLK